MIFPGHTVLSMGAPVGTTPAIPFKPDHFPDEVPCPDDPPGLFQCVHPRSQRGQVHATVSDSRCREDWLPAVNLCDDLAILPIQHVVVAGHRADVEIRPGDGRCRNVVAVSGATARRERPAHLMRQGIDGVHHPGTVDHEDLAVGDNRCAEQGIRAGDGSHQSHRERQRLSRGISGPDRIPL